jgi:ABC-type dipeptide/oligopeptide/nickel transport system permease component
VPVIVLGPIFVWVFGIELKWLPPTGWAAKPPFFLGFLPSALNWEFFQHALMPSIALGLGSSAVIARLTRATLLQTIREDYIRTARSKGLHERTIITHHALKNSLIPVVTVLGPLFAALVTGTFVTELIFGIPGMGKYFVTSITNRDYPVIMGTILLYAVFLVLANLIVDIMYAYLDPRIRYD